MKNSIYYSDAGTTKEITDYIAKKLSGRLEEINLKEEEIEEIISYSQNDIVILGMPVYAGRIVQSSLKSLRKLEGNGAVAVAVAVYGNRHYDDALIEMVDLLREQGFYVLAGSCFIAQHSLLPLVATERPDKEDYKKIDEFIELCKQKLNAEHTEIEVPGNRPYEGNPLEFVIAKEVSKGMPIDRKEFLSKEWAARKEPEWYL